MPTPPSVNPTFETIADGIKTAKTFSALVSEKPLFETRSRKPQTNLDNSSIVKMSLLYDDEEGEDLSSMWDALHYVDDSFEMIEEVRRSLHSTSCPFLDKMCKEDLLEFLFPVEFEQLCEYGYIEANES